MEPFQLSSRVGDVVKLPSGELGIISKVEFLCFYHCKQVTVFPIFASFLKRLVGFFLIWYRFEDQEINKLQKIGSLSNLSNQTA